MSRPSKRDVRHRAALLKAQGLIYQNRDLSRGPVTDYMRRKVAKLEADLARGELVRGEQRSGADIRNALSSVRPDAVFSHGKTWAILERRGESVQTFREGMLVVVKPLPTGHFYEEILIPGGNDISNVMAWLRDGRAERMKRPEEEFAFRLGGGMSYLTFRSDSAMVQQLEHYNAIGEETEGLSLRIFRVYPPGHWMRLKMTDRQEALQFVRDKSAKLRGRARRSMRLRLKSSEEAARKASANWRTALDELEGARKSAKYEAFFQKEREKQRRHREKFSSELNARRRANRKEESKKRMDRKRKSRKGK